MLIRKLFRTAGKYKVQFISMVIMIAIGTGVFLGFNIEWKSIEANTSAFFEETKYADFRLYSETGFTDEDIRAIQKIQGVDAATRFLSVNADIIGTKTAVALIVSENYTVCAMYLSEGSPYDENSDGIWLSDQFAEKNGYKIGDSLTLSHKGIAFDGEIVGLIKSGEMMICTADQNQLMPDFTSFGFAYISPKKLEKVVGSAFYPQIHILADMAKAEIEQAIKNALGKTILIASKEEHTAYAGAQSETEEGKTMGTILPVLFLAIGILTMVTTMHRIAANEKTQIGTLKALGFRDRRILRHYTSYGFVIGVFGCLLGIALGYGLAAVIISPNGMMSTYFDLPHWRLVMPGFCIPVILLTVSLLTLISFISVKKMLNGTAADALRPYEPNAMKKSIFEDAGPWNKLSFGTKWNIRDILRHKSRSVMTLIGVIGCMVLLVGGIGMKDTMDDFMRILNKDISNYTTKVNLSETALNGEAIELAKNLNGDWAASSGVSLKGETVVMEVYHAENGLIRFVDANNERMELTNDGVYLCQRLKNTAQIGDTIEISPYGSEETYTVRVAGYLRSVLSETVVMTDVYAGRAEIDYHITSIYTDKTADEIANSPLIAGKQEKQAIMATYDSFLDIMNVMVLMFVAGAITLGIVVLYNLGLMSYVERSRELATLKVLGFRDRHIGRLLISQNIWLTAIGVIIGLPAGIGVLQALLITLGNEYELKLCLGVLTYSISLLVTVGVSLIVSLMVARKNKKIDMVEALKGAE
ncbi:MAG: ABC transporter permease [Clostridiales bacterium]|nr:ABC transporter permease [Clostridiales bacterium]